MGNLHAGHLALVRAGRAAADRVATSIYVNPIQFGAGEDFSRYPRTLEADLRHLAEAGCDLAFVPADETVYPHGPQDATRLRAAPSLADVLEGASRPGHFDGVVSVVARLFALVAPDLAVFGEKDYQQLLVIRRMVDDLGFAIRIVAVPTVRGTGGLALSSRNRYLDEGEHSMAERLNGVLEETARRVRQARGSVTAAERHAAGALEKAGLRVDYVAVRRASDLALPAKEDEPLRVLAAVWCGATRLIDNCPVG